MNKPRVGQKIKTWVSGTEDGFAKVLRVRKYAGAYPQYFQWIVRVTAKNTVEGWTEIVL